MNIKFKQEINDYEEIMNKYRHTIFKDRLTIHEPIKVEDFMIIKFFIKRYNLNIKNIVVE